MVTQHQHPACLLMFLHRHEFFVTDIIEQELYLTSLSILVTLIAVLG